VGPRAAPDAAASLSHIQHCNDDSIRLSTNPNELTYPLVI